jgi:hypothetical protein
MDYVKLQDDLDKALIGPQQLLSGTKVLTESSRESPAYLDRRHFPFWYHLGKQLPDIDRVMQVGPYLGLVGSCLLQSCSVAEWNVCSGGAYEITKSNIRLHSPKTETKFVSPEECGEVGLALITENCDLTHDPITELFNLLWDCLAPEGLLVCDYINSDAQGEAFEDFCRVKNRESHTFKTRYGVGIIER